MFIRQKLLKHGYTDSVTDIIFFIVCKICFFGVMEAFNLKGIIIVVYSSDLARNQTEGRVFLMDQSESRILYPVTPPILAAQKGSGS